MPFVLSLLVRSGAVALLFASVRPMGAVAQSRTVHDCQDCDLRLERVAVLGGPDLPFEFGSGAILAITSDGRYLATPFGATELALFGPDGGFERLVGGPGAGPGEFGDIASVAVGPGDTIYVFEFPAQITRLTADLRYHDRFVPALPAAPQGWTVMPDGATAFVAVQIGTGLRGDRLWVFEPGGAVRASFSPAPRAYHLSDYNETVGFLSPSPRYGGLWFAKLNEYSLHLFVDRRETKTVVRETDWFAPWQGPLGGEGLVEPKRPGVAGVAERPDGRLTVVTLVADADWEQNRPRIVRGRLEHGLNPDLLPRQLMFDSMVEILDPETDEVLATARSDDAVHLPVGGDGTVVYAARADDIGRYRIHVYRLQLPRE